MGIRRLNPLAFALLTGACFSAHGGQNAAGQVNLPSSIADAGATVQVVCSNKIETEGPIFDYDGNFYFTERPRNASTRIWKIAKGGTVPVLYRDSVNGSNGLGIDSKNRLIACQMNAVTRREPDGSITSLFTKADGADIKVANDIYVASNDGMYITLSDIGKILYWNSGNTVRTIASPGYFPNGILVDESRKKLYVDLGNKNQMVRYDIAADHSLGSIYTFPAEVGKSPDGFTMDEKRNLYVACWSANAGVNELVVLDSTGQRSGNIVLNDVHMTNCVFGGPLGKTLYITAGTGVYSVELKIRGLEAKSSATAIAVESGRPEDSHFYPESQASYHGFLWMDGNMPLHAVPFDLRGRVRNASAHFAPHSPAWTAWNEAGSAVIK